MARGRQSVDGLQLAAKVLTTITFYEDSLPARRRGNGLAEPSQRTCTASPVTEMSAEARLVCIL